MVQKAFYALLLEDIKENQEALYEPALVDQLRKGQFKFDGNAVKILQKSQFANEWKDKCERSLKLSKLLGNIYTGSLYNGLVSVLCDKAIDLSDKKVMLFSYGSGCAASMFFVHVKKGYQHHPLVLNSEFQGRLDRRV